MKDVVQIPWLCHRLRLTREVLQLTLDSVGKRMGVQRAYISNLELCRKEPKLSTVIRYADILGINLATLFSGCPTTDGKREIPTVDKCRVFLRRLEVKRKDMNQYFSKWPKHWSPEADGEWGLADELLWLDTLARLDSPKWKELAGKQAVSRLAAKMDELSGMMNLFEGLDDEEL